MQTQGCPERLGRERGAAGPGRPFGFRPEAPESVGEVFSLRVQEDVSGRCRGSTFSAHHLSPGFSGPKHALISWMERKKEAWSPEAEEP